MGLLGNNEAKKEEKVQKLLAKYGLQNLSDPRDIEAVKNIATDLAGNKAIEYGTLLLGNSEEAVKMSYLNAIMQQNFIIIRLLDRIAKK